MGLFDKVKNFFYEEYEDIEENEEIHNEVKREHKKNVNQKREDMSPKKQDEITERELFKAESTFNFPMDLDDTIYEKTTQSRVTREKKEEPVREVKINTYTSSTAYQKRTYPTEKINSSKEEKKFMPTPIISPIYGVLDKNYKKEELSYNNEKNLNITKKLNYDEVMKKAMKKVDDIDEENKSIFFNLDEEKEENNDEEVKIIYNDVSIDDKVDNTNNDEINEPSIDEDNILSETKEQDLFNLIDNMYSSDDDEEDED